MKQKIKDKAQQIAQSPKTKEVVSSVKPEKSVWGFLGVVVFFILPEIVAFIWGADITAYAKEQLPLAASFIERQYFELLVMLFEEGGSWVNLGIGIALLIWLFY
jgi:hypothetical protein